MRKTVMFFLLIPILSVYTPARHPISTAYAASALGRVRAIRHGLGVQPPHHKAHQGKRRDPLYNLYTLATRAHEGASIVFRDHTVLYINQRTTALLHDPSVTRVQTGEVDFVHPPGTKHRVVTSAASASAIGTNFDVRVKGKRTVFIVASGALRVKNKRGTVTVKANQQTTVTPTTPPTTPAPVDAAAAIGWTVGLSAGGWQVLNASPDIAPKGVAVGPQGTIYATDYTGKRVLEVSPAGKVMRTWGTAGTGSGQFEAPTGITADANGNVYVSDPVNDIVQRFNADGVYQSTLGSGTPTSDPGQFFSPDSLATDDAGNLYVADQGNDRIQSFGPDGSVRLNTLTVANPPDLTEPQGVAVDAHGNIYVADTLNSRVVELAPDGHQITVFGSKGSGFGQLNLPFGLAVDGAGNVFVADTLNNRVEEFGPDGAPLTTFGQYGTGAGQFDQPNDVYVDHHGNLYVTDSHRIQRLLEATVPLP